MNVNDNLEAKGQGSEEYDPRSLDFSTLRKSVLMQDGYLMVDKPKGHPHKGRRMMFQRLVMEKKIGRILKKGEVVHHKNEDKWNNHPENLEVFENSREHHVKRHDAIKHKRLWDKEWLEREYSEMKRSTQDIADEIGCNRVNVRNAIIKQGIVLRRYTTTQAVLDHVKEAALKGGRKPKNV